MTRYTWLAMFLFVAVTTAGSATYAAESAKADEAAISKIEHEWGEAVKTQNKGFFAKNLAEDFTFIDETGGFTKRRSAYVENVMKLPKISEYSITDETVRVQGTTGVATGRFSVKDSNGTDVVRYTDTYVKGPDGWKAIAGQETKTK